MPWIPAFAGMTDERARSPDQGGYTHAGCRRSRRCFAERHVAEQHRRPHDQPQLPRLVEDLRPWRRGAAAPPAPSRSRDPDRRRADRRRARCQHRGHRRRDLRHHGALGLRQIHAGALPVAAGGGHRRRGHLRGPRPAARRRKGADRDPPPQDGHGVPAFRAAAPSLRPRQCRLSPLGPGRRPGRAREARPRGDRARGPARPRGAFPAPALRRPAAARRHRPQPGRQAPDLVPGRALLGAGPADPARDAGRAAPPPGRAAQDGGLHHP